MSIFMHPVGAFCNRLPKIQWRKSRQKPPKMNIFAWLVGTVANRSYGSPAKMTIFASRKPPLFSKEGVGGELTSTQ